MPTQEEFLAEIARKVAASDAKADADLADILAGRPFQRTHPPKTETAEAAPVPKKPRARRAPARKKPAPIANELD